MDTDCSNAPCTPLDIEVSGVLVAFDLNEGTLEIYVQGEWPDINRTVHFTQRQRSMVASSGMAIGRTAAVVAAYDDDGKLQLLGVQSKMNEGVAAPPLGDLAQPSLFA